MKSVIALILGGGAGTRLRPLTQNRSKPAIPFLGKYRLVDIPVSNCLNAGINRIFVLTQYNSASLNNYISRTYRFNDFNNGFISVLAAEQTPDSSNWYNGTADAVRQVMRHLGHYAFSHVLVLSADQIYQMDFEAMLQHHTQEASDVTVATVNVGPIEATRFGILKTDKDYNITRFREKPAIGELEDLVAPFPTGPRGLADTFTASTGIYLFKRDVLEEMLNDNPHFTDFGSEVIPDGINTYALKHFPVDGYWSDVGTIREYHQANLFLSEPDSPFQYYDELLRVYTEPQVLPPARVFNSTIDGAIISEGSQVYSSYISHSVLGPRSYIGEHSRLKNVVMLGAAYYEGDQGVRNMSLAGPVSPGVKSHCLIEDAILDVNVSIGRGCTIRNQDGVQEGEGKYYRIRDGIIVIPENMAIPAGTVIGTSQRPRLLTEPVNFPQQLASA